MKKKVFLTVAAIIMCLTLNANIVAYGEEVHNHVGDCCQDTFSTIEVDDYIPITPAGAFICGSVGHNMTESAFATRTCNTGCGPCTVTAYYVSCTRCGHGGGILERHSNTNMCRWTDIGGGKTVCTVCGRVL